MRIKTVVHYGINLLVCESLIRDFSLRRTINRMILRRMMRPLVWGLRFHARHAPNHQSPIFSIMGVFSRQREREQRGIVEDVNMIDRAEDRVEILDRDRPTGTNNHRSTAITKPGASNQVSSVFHGLETLPPYSVIRLYYCNAPTAMSAQDRWSSPDNRTTFKPKRIQHPTCLWSWDGTRMAHWVIACYERH